MSHSNDNAARPQAPGDIIELGLASVATQGGVDGTEPIGPGAPAGIGIAEE